MGSQRRQEIEQAFFRHYDTQPTIWVQASGRVDLMGSHINYNEGFVLTEAIECNTWNRRPSPR
jgi:galactokinase